MNRKLLIGIITLIVGLVIAAAILRPMFIWWIFWLTLMGAWIWLIVLALKKKTGIFHSHLAPERAKRLFKWLKVFILAGGISFAMFIVGAIMHNAQYARSGEEEAVFFSIALIGGFILFFTNIGSLIIFLIGRHKAA